MLPDRNLVDGGGKRSGERISAAAGVNGGVHGGGEWKLWSRDRGCLETEG